MNEDPLQYDKWVQEALRGVIRRALEAAVSQGLSGDHHFYIAFKTGAAGVVAPRRIVQQQGGEMTIVLQHQYSGLAAGEDEFQVTLSFGGRAEKLVIPYAAITTFSDPSVDFNLLLGSAGGESGKGEGKQAAPREEGGEEGGKEGARKTVPVAAGDAARQAPPGKPEDGRKKAGDEKKDEKDKDEKDGDEKDGDEKSGQVIALDAFRKK